MQQRPGSQELLPRWEPFLVPREAGASCGERGCNGSPAPCKSLNNGASLLWRSGFPLQAFLVADFLTSIPSGCLRTVNRSLLPGSALQTPHFSTQPPYTLATHLSGWGTQGCGEDHLCRSHSVLPATDRLLGSPPIAPKVPLLSQLISSLVRGLPRVREPHLTFSSPKGCRSHPTSSPLPFPFFLSSYPVTQGSFLSF